MTAPNPRGPGLSVTQSSAAGGGSPSAGRAFTLAALPVTVDGQTAFTLVPAPFAGTLASLLLYVNGVLYVQGVDYTIAGTTLTWLDAAFTLETTDTVIAIYQVPPPTTSTGAFVLYSPPIAADGQTAFTLTPAPFAGTAATMQVFVNGVFYVQGTDYTVAGAALTWLDVPFTLATTDTLVAIYEV